MALLGIMQGRLVSPVEGRFQSFPRGRWVEEFPAAANAGLDAIEWIYDEFGASENPLACDDGIARMLALMQSHRVRVESVCADYFMDRPLVRASQVELADRIAVLRWLIGRCNAVGIRRIVLPFVDVSKIDNEADKGNLLRAIDQVLPTAEEAGVELHLESSLPPADFADLLCRIPHTLVKVNYDSGNSAALGYDVREEFDAYGPRVGSVHIKDRLRGGTTVPLGQGNADLATLFDCLKRECYCGDFILQVARGPAGQEVSWAQHNRATVLPFMQALNRVTCN